MHLNQEIKCFGHWMLGFEIYLEFGAWNLESKISADDHRVDENADNLHSRI
jgi:hypothetical protein